MPILLFRVDDRLIHGQVVLGWGRRLHPTHYLIVDDDLAHEEWEQELYRLTLGDEATVEFVTVARASALLPGLRSGPERTVVLTRGLEAMAELAEGGRLAGDEVNLGGLHHAPGREAVRPYLHLDARDRENVRRLVEAGVDVSGQDLPDSPRVGVRNLLSS